MDWFKNNALKADVLVYGWMAAALASAALGTAPLTIGCAIAAAIWIFSGLAWRSRSIYRHLNWCAPVWVMIVLPWVGLLYTADTYGLGLSYAQKTVHWVFGLAMAAAVVRLSTDKLVRAFLLGLAVNALIGTCQLIGVLPANHGWYSGLGRGYSTLSAYLILGMLLASFYFRRSTRSRSRWALLALMGFYFFHLVILEGRTGYVTFVVLSPLMIHNLTPRLRLWRLALICVLVVAAMFVSPVVRQRAQLSVSQLRYHLHAKSDQAWGKTYSAQQDRFYMWHGAFKIFMQHPLIGVGTGGYQTVLKQMGPPKVPTHAHPHNDILYMAASYGVVGLVVFAWLFGVMLRNGWRHRHRLAGYAVWATAWVVLVSGLFNAQTLDVGMAIVLALIYGWQQRLTAPAP